MRYRQRFDLQEDGIRGRPGQGKLETASPADQDPLSHALEQVVAAGVDFWEVYLPEIENPSMNNVLKRASIQLPALDRCKH
jgi:hypothetical protein